MVQANAVKNCHDNRIRIPFYQSAGTDDPEMSSAKYSAVTDEVRCAYPQRACGVLAISSLRTPYNGSRQHIFQETATNAPCLKNVSCLILAELFRFAIGNVNSPLRALCMPGNRTSRATRTYAYRPARVSGMAQSGGGGWGGSGGGRRARIRIIMLR